MCQAGEGHAPAGAGDGYPAVGDPHRPSRAREHLAPAQVKSVEAGVPEAVKQRGRPLGASRGVRLRILLQGIGNAVIDHSVTDEEILSAAGSVICQEPVEAGR